MDVPVRIELLIPSVQHHQRRHFETLLLFDRRFERPPTGRKQQVIDHPAVSQGERRELLREGQHHLKVVDAVDQDGLRFFHPLGAFAAAATGAVPVSARVVQFAFTFTAFASVPPRTEHFGPTQRDFGKRALNLRASLPRELTDKLCRVVN